MISPKDIKYNQLEEVLLKFRQLSMVDDVTKNDVINFWKENLNVIKNYMTQMLTKKGVRII